MTEEIENSKGGGCGVNLSLLNLVGELSLVSICSLRKFLSACFFLLDLEVLASTNILQEKGYPLLVARCAARTPQGWVDTELADLSFHQASSFPW